MSDINRKLGIVQVGTPDMNSLYQANIAIDSGINAFQATSVKNISNVSNQFNIFSKQVTVPYTGVDSAAYLDSTNLQTYLSSGPSGIIGPGVRTVGGGPSLPSGGLNNPVIANAYWEAYSSSSGVFVWLGPQSGYELWNVTGRITGRRLGEQVRQWNSLINFYKINPTGNNIVEVTNKPIIVTASGNWGGYGIEWQSSPDKINWGNFNLSQIPRNINAFPSIGGYFFNDERSTPDIINVVSGGNVLLNKEYLNIGVWSGFSGLVCPTIGGYTFRTLYSGLNNGSWDRLSLLRFESNCNSLNSFGGISGTWTLSLAYLETGTFLRFTQPPTFIPYPTMRWRGDKDNYYFVPNSSSISEVDMPNANWQASSFGTTTQLPIPKFIPFYRRSRNAGNGIYVYSGQLPSGHKYLRLRDPAGILGGGNLNVSLTYSKPDESKFESEWPKPCEYFNGTILASEYLDELNQTGVPATNLFNSLINNTGNLTFDVNILNENLSLQYVTGTFLTGSNIYSTFGHVINKDKIIFEKISGSLTPINPIIGFYSWVSGSGINNIYVTSDNFDYVLEPTGPNDFKISRSLTKKEWVD
jgi:hypothetical protein